MPTLANQQASFQRHASAAHEQQRGAAAEACVCEFARLCVYKGVETDYVLARWRWVIADGDASTEKAQTLTQTTHVHTHTTEYPDNGLNTTEKERLVHVFSYPTEKTHFL